MKEKVYQCCKKLNDTKTWKRIVPFLYLVLIIIFSIFAYKNHSFYYPEKEYQVLEEEAYRLAIQNEFCLELETDYKCIIDYYNIDSNDVTFRLIDSEYKLYGSSNKYIQPAPISISVSVDNCKATDREIKEIKRMEKSASGHIGREILAIIVLPICLIGMLGSIVVLIIQLYILFYESKLEKGKSNSKT